MKGFTLIELLVVITIIAIISSIGFVLYTQFNKNARDAKRQSDLKFIQSALEDYRADQFYYPDSIPFGSALTAPGNPNKDYLKKIPNDPRPPAVYSYSGQDCTGSECKKYCLSAKLEGTNLANECAPAPGYNYGVTRP